MTERIIDFDKPGEAQRVAEGIRGMHGTWRLQLCRYRPRRSDAQNAWLWGCVYPAIRQGISNVWGEEFTNEEIHEWAKTKWLSKDMVDPKTGEMLGLVPGSTAKLNTEQFTEYIENLRKFAAEYLDIDIPDPTPQEQPQEQAA